MYLTPFFATSAARRSVFSYHSLPPSMMTSPGSSPASRRPEMVPSTGAPALTRMMTRLDGEREREREKEKESFFLREGEEGESECEEKVDREMMLKASGRPLREDCLCDFSLSLSLSLGGPLEGGGERGRESGKKTWWSRLNVAALVFSTMANEEEHFFCLQKKKKKNHDSWTHRGFSRLATNSLRSLKPLRLVRPVDFGEEGRGGREVSVVFFFAA